MGRSHANAVTAAHVRAARRLINGRLAAGTACVLCGGVELEACRCTLRDVAEFLARQRTLPGVDLNAPVPRPAVPALRGSQGRLF